MSKDDNSTAKSAKYHGKSKSKANQTKEDEEVTLVQKESHSSKDKNASDPYNISDTGNTTADLNPQKNASDKIDNSGAAVFLYTDSATGVSQKFAFNLRYYIHAE